MMDIPQPENMKNITSSLRQREIAGRRVSSEARELFDEISYLPLLRKIGATEQLLDNLTRAIMQTDEGEIYLILTEILTKRAMYCNTDETLGEDEKERLNKLINLLREFIKDPDYVWSIENQVKLVDRLEEEYIWSPTLEELEEQYEAERFERYEELEYDGYSTD